MNIGALLMVLSIFVYAVLHLIKNVRANDRLAVADALCLLIMFGVYALVAVESQLIPAEVRRNTFYLGFGFFFVALTVRDYRDWLNNKIGRVQGRWVAWRQRGQ
jgi:hypothetical protein